MNMPRHIFPVVKAANKTFDWTERPGEDLISETEWDAIKAYARLSRRESQVCRLLFEGQKRDRIAELLGISPRTVRYHLETLHKKLKVNTRVGLVLRMVQIQKFLSSEPQASRVH
jgi:DNA-binding CsgD family transcriptional regulator